MQSRFLGHLMGCVRDHDRNKLREVSGVNVYLYPL